MGLLRNIIKAGKKAVKSPVGKVAAPLLIGYVEKQSADARKIAPIVQTVLQAHAAVKAAGSQDVLKDTATAVAASGVLNQVLSTNPVASVHSAQNPLQGVFMPTEIATPPIIPAATVTPVKNGVETSSFKLTGIALILIPLVPGILTWLQQYIGTLPQNSVPAVVGGIVLMVAQYVWNRYKTTNGERQASAQLAEAQAGAIIAQTKITSTALPTAQVGSTPAANTSAAATPANDRPTNDNLGDDTSHEITSMAEAG